MPLGSGPRLREAVRVVTDGTLGLLSRSLLSKPQPVYKNALETKPLHRQSSSQAKNTFSSPSQNCKFDNTTNANSTATMNSAYIQPEAQITHQPTSYPASTQYTTYPDSSNVSTVTYAPQDNYTSYPPSSSIEAPLLTTFATQASQVTPNNWRSNSQPVYSGSSAWQQWTTTMTGNLGLNIDSQDCYSANALMQLGGRDIANGDGTQVNVSIAGLTTAVTGLDQSQLGQSANGMQWPLNMFDN